VANIRTELEKILAGDARERMLEGYKEVSRALGDKKAPDNAARLINDRLKIKH
jgi:lipid-A-disaccharide synthase